MKHVGCICDPSRVRSSGVRISSMGMETKLDNEMTGEIGKIYDKAKQGHARGIVLLEKEFGYHPR
jgi:hypothetical protein